MLNYLRAEFYKLFRRKYTWITLAVLLGIELCIVGVFVLVNETGGRMSFVGCCEIMVQFLLIGSFLPIFTCDMVCGNPHKNGTFKNEVSFGISRVTIYLGKFLAQLIASFALCALMAGFYLGLSAIFAPHDPLLDGIALRHVGQSLALALPVWIGIQGACCACTFLFRSSLGAAMMTLCLLLVIPFGMNLMGTFFSMQGVALEGASRVMLRVADNTPVPFLNDLYYLLNYEGWQWSVFGVGCAMGGFWLVLSTGLGMLGFARKEIN